MEKEDHIALLIGKYGIPKIYAYELVIGRFHCVVCEKSRNRASNTYFRRRLFRFCSLGKVAILN